MKVKTSVAVTVAALLLGVTTQASEIQQYELNKGFAVGDPIAASNGSYQFSLPLLDLGGAIPLRVTLNYDLANIFGNLNGCGFNFITLFWVGGSATTTRYASVFFGDSLDRIMFESTDGGDTWVLNNCSRQYVLKETGDDQTSGYYYLLDPFSRLVYIFEKQSNEKTRLKHIVDRNGNKLTYEYSGTGVYPSSLYEGAGATGDRRLNFVWEYTTCLLSATEVIGGVNTRQATFSYNEARLATASDPLGNTTNFTWASNKSIYGISAVTRPEDNTPYTQTLALSSSSKTVTAQTDAYGNVTNLTYVEGVNDDITTTEARPDGTDVIYKHFGKYSTPEGLTDATGNKMGFTRSDNNQLTSVTDRLGATTSYAFHVSGLPASVTDAKGGVTTYVYAAQDQTIVNPSATTESVTFTFYSLASITCPDGSQIQFGNDAKGNAVSITDQAGNATTFTYDAAGRPLTSSNALGGGFTATYNADGTLASYKTSDTGTTTFAYDLHKRPVTVTNPDATTETYTYDANDRTLSHTDGNGATTSFAYNGNGLLTAITAPTGSQKRFAYDQMDRLVGYTDALDNQTLFDYNNLGQLAGVTAPSGLTKDYAYDVRGWRNAVTLGGQTWTTGHDAEGVDSSRSTPLGNVTSYQTDNLAQAIKTTDPLGAATAFARDAMSRVTSLTDPLARVRGFAYDPRGLLTQASAPIIGSAQYARDANGKLTAMTDPRGNGWNFSRTSLGALKSMTDPLGNVWTFTRDSLGRVATVAYPTGATLTYTYDAAGRVTRQLYSDGADLQFEYNQNGRLIATNNVTLVRDANDRVRSTETAGAAFSATYDNDGRLKTVGYNNNAFTVTYAYDEATGLLTSVTDSLTNATVAFTYDRDRRLIGVTRSNGVTTTIAYDKAGRPTDIADGSIISLKQTYDAAGQVTSVDMTAPIDPGECLAVGTQTLAFDAASQIATNGYVYDACGRLTATNDYNAFAWNADSRLITTNDATMTYNGLGDIATRSAGGNTIQYGYNYALGLHPIVAEKNQSAGAFVRYYVWTPDGQLLYLIENATKEARFYHFDHMGSTLAITGADGAVTDAYAYTPFGKLLKHEGVGVQPFTFIGKWGVRREGDSGRFYQMRARYYDAGTCRFLSRDPLWPNIADPAQVNPYQYAANNPLKYLDPTGLEFTQKELAWMKELREKADQAPDGKSRAYYTGCIEALAEADFFRDICAYAEQQEKEREKNKDVSRTVYNLGTGRWEVIPPEREAAVKSAALVPSTPVSAFVKAFMGMTQQAQSTGGVTAAATSSEGAPARRGGGGGLLNDLSSFSLNNAPWELDAPTLPTGSSGVTKHEILNDIYAYNLDKTEFDL